MDKYVLLRSAVTYYRDNIPKLEADSPLEQIVIHSIEQDVLDRVLSLMNYIDSTVIYKNPKGELK